MILRLYFTTKGAEKQMTNEEMAAAVKQENKNHLIPLWNATRKLIYHYLLRMIAGNPVNRERMVSRGLTMDDIQQEAFFILIHAIEAFQPEKGYTFSHQLFYSTKTVFLDLIGIRTAKGRKDIMCKAQSLDAPLPGEYDDESICLSDTIADEEASEAFQTVIDDQFHEQFTADIQDVINDLPPNEREAINGIYFKGETLKQIGAEQDVSIEAVRQYHMSALRKLRKGNALRRLRPYAVEIIDRYAYHGSVGAFKNTWSSSTEIAAMKIEARETRQNRYRNA